MRKTTENVKDSYFQKKFFQLWTSIFAQTFCQFSSTIRAHVIPLFVIIIIQVFKLLVKVLEPPTTTSAEIYYELKRRLRKCHNQVYRN